MAQMIQCTVPREDTDERGPVSALCLIVNSGRLIPTCQPPLPNEQTLALLAGEACPESEQERPFSSLGCDLRAPDRGQVIMIYMSLRPFGPSDCGQLHHPTEELYGTGKTPGPRGASAPSPGLQMGPPRP